MMIFRFAIDFARPSSAGSIPRVPGHVWDAKADLCATMPDFYCFVPVPMR